MVDGVRDGSWAKSILRHNDAGRRSYSPRAAALPRAVSMNAGYDTETAAAAYERLAAHLAAASAISRR
jgi:hypothetical protein